jgi:hypothetical protein
VSRSSGRPTVEGYQALELSIDHLLGAGAVAQRLRWSEPRGVVDVAILLDQTPPVAVLSYEVDHAARPTGPRVQRVDLVPVPWGFGGVRWHWVCSETGRLARKLYLPSGGVRFLSRHAYGFTWRTHHASPLARSHARLARIAKRLGAPYRGDVARWKCVIGDGLRSQADGRQATEMAIAADVLNRMLELGRPEYVRIA